MDQQRALDILSYLRDGFFVDERTAALAASPAHPLPGPAFAGSALLQRRKSAAGARVATRPTATQVTTVTYNAELQAFSSVRVDCDFSGGGKILARCHPPRGCPPPLGCWPRLSVHCLGALAYLQQPRGPGSGPEEP